MSITIVALLFGLAVLTVGGELLVRGSSKLAEKFGIPQLIIGLTIVAFGTSSPELVVSIKAAWQGQSDIALGNVVGSNIFNVLFIFGVSALIVPLVVSKQLLRLDVPIMIAVSILCLLLGLDGSIGRMDGVVLVVLLGIYIFQMIRISKRVSAQEKIEDIEIATAKPQANLYLVGMIILGLITLIIGAQSFLWGAVEIAKLFGMSELVIGLTIVAAGTSLPEVATSIIAAIKGQRDIAIGNVVGSNIFNILCVLGVSALINPINVAPAALSFDIPVMIAVACVCLPLFFTGFSIARWEGAFLLAFYVAYTAYLIMDQSGHDHLPVFSSVMMSYVLPLAVVVVLASGGLEYFKKRSTPAK